MIAIIFTMGNIYDCNLDHKRDQIWLQWWSQWGHNMNAILIIKGSKYNCKLISETGHFRLQSFQIRTKYDCNVKNRLKIMWLWFLDWSCENKFSIIAIIFNPNWKRLQSYRVSFELVIAIIFNPHLIINAIIFGSSCNEDCNHIWSPWWKLLQSYVVHP